MRGEESTMWKRW